jgi:hypothetical protein
MMNFPRELEGLKLALKHCGGALRISKRVHPHGIAIKVRSNFAAALTFSLGPFLLDS